MRTGIETTSCLGTIQIHTNELGYDEDIEMVASGYDILRKKKNIMTPSFYQIRHEHEDSYPCFVRGIQVLSNGDAVLLDESNMKLKHLDENLKLSSVKKLPRKPLDFCVFVDKTNEEFQVAVCYDEFRKIGVYTASILKDGIMWHLDREFPTKYYCVSLSALRDNICLLFSETQLIDDAFSEIQTRDKNGSVLASSQIPVNARNAKRVKIFGNCVFFAGHSEVAIYSVEERWLPHMGTYRLSFKPRNNHEILHFSGTCDIVAGFSGTVYICCKQSKKIHFLSSQNFQESRDPIHCDNIPTSLAFDSESNKLFVGFHGVDYIAVYKIENENPFMF